MKFGWIVWLLEVASSHLIFGFTVSYENIDTEKILLEQIQETLEETTLLTSAQFTSESVDVVTLSDSVDNNFVQPYDVSEKINYAFSKYSAQYNQSHPCLRQCVKGEKPLECNYRFEIGWYFAMSKACHNCATNVTDCYREDCITADGVKRTLIVVNRLLPGPSIEVCLGDKINVDLVNNLSEETTSIHWHGHHQRGSPYMDGVPFVTQCPVLPHTVFRYKYTADNVGTHFWHSHTGLQRGDGAVGSFIVRVPRSEDPHSALFDFDLPEHTIIVFDWSHELGVTMFASHYHSDGDNKPESMIVNGKGRYFNDTSNITNTPLAAFSVIKGLRYRFRLINAGVQNCPVELSIDNHILKIISSDGFDLQPKIADTFVSYAGERWDFVLEATQDVNNYWMRFTGLMDCDQRFTKAHQVAILRYEGASDDEPKAPVGYNIHGKKDLQVNSLNVKRNEEGTMSIPDLVSLNNDDDPSLKEVPDQQLYISFDFYKMDNPHYHKPKLYGFWEVPNKERVLTPQFNYISMKLPDFPLLSQFQNINNKTLCDFKTHKNCTESFCECTNIINIALGDVVELILIDKGVSYNANHPFHLHGHAFRVIGMDRLGEETNEDTIRFLDKAGHIHRNFKNPPIKDTVTVPDGGYTIIRFHASNPGYWIFHCHIEFHVEVGMALIFKIGEHSSFPPVPPEFPQCGNYYYPTEDGDHNKKTKEIDFNFDETYSNSISYNITRPENEIYSLSFSHWWPYITNKTSAKSCGFKYLDDLVLVSLIFCILNFL
uniref:Laccase n=2 Tax=Clastoptera arizonana TaxID=38151 RepID=A0A1B6BZ72_9HEMI